MKQISAIAMVIFLALLAPIYAQECPQLLNQLLLRAETQYKIFWHKRELLQTYGMKLNGEGAHFSIWLPNAKDVYLYTSLDWNRGFQLSKNGDGVWAAQLNGVIHGTQYKLKIVDANYHTQFRIDPYSNFTVRASDSMIWNSVVWDKSRFRWSDQTFTPNNGKMKIVEVHPGTIIPGSRFANFREIADYLVMRYKDKVTHVSLMPVTHHNVEESWGYQPGSLFSVNYRHGTPDDLKYLVNRLHENGMAVIFDLVYGHASMDWDTGLAMIDGTELYFKQGIMGSHPEWGTHIYDFGKEDVSNLLLANTKYWIEEFHIDGARMDGVASMIYLDYGRKGNWISHPADGSNRDHEAMLFLRDFNAMTHQLKPSFVTIAEDSSGNWNTTRSLTDGGLGFDYTWGIGGMHTIRTFAKSSPADRNLFALYEPFNNHDWGRDQRYINYFNSHDEAAHGKRLLIEMINGASQEEQYDISRMLFAHIYAAIPGRPMIFQGDEFANRGWWDHMTSPGMFNYGDIRDALHTNYIKALGDFYEREPAFYRTDLDSAHLLMVDNSSKVAVSARFGMYESDTLVIVHNFHGWDHPNYRIPVPHKGRWSVVFDSNQREWGGNGIMTIVGPTENYGIYGTPYSVHLNIPDHTTLILKQVQ